MMKRRAIFLLAAAALLLSGCATIVRTDVLAFNSWPASLPDTSFVFAYPRVPDSIEYRTAETMVRQQLYKIGLRDAATGAGAKLVVTVDYHVGARDVRVISPMLMDPYWMGPGWYGPYRRGWYGRGFWPYGGYPYGPATYDDTTVHIFNRQLHVTIAEAGGGKKLYEVLVENTSKIENPYLVLAVLAQNAFDGFPGQNGVVRTIEVQVPDK